MNDFNMAKFEKKLKIIMLFPCPSMFTGCFKQPSGDIVIGDKNINKYRQTKMTET